MTLLGDFGRVFARAFHSSPIACAKPSKRRLEHILRNVPKYPYPIKHTFKQSWFGLYGGKHIQFGNNVPKNFLRYKTRRQWLPNVRHRSVYSRSLGTHFSLDITASVLRTIDKVGGLDAYLTGTKPARLKELGPTGWRLRWRVLNSPRYQRELQEERKRLGLLEGQEPVFSREGGTLEDALGMLSPGQESIVPEEPAVSPAQELMARIERERAMRRKKKTKP